MNQGRVWCVVNPTLGLPLLLGSVALTSLAVHTSVMTNTTWMSNYWQGSSSRPKVAEGAAAAGAANIGAAFSVTVAPVPATDAKSPASFVITVTPNVAATAQPSLVAAPPGDRPSAGLIRAASMD